MTAHRSVLAAITLCAGTAALASPPVLAPAALGPGSAPGPSDTVLIVDTSRFTEDRIDELGDALAALADHVAASGHPDDRVALVIYAGEAYTVDLSDPDVWLPVDPSNPFAPPAPLPPAAAADALVSPVSTPDAPLVAAGLRPCDIDPASWAEAYRFMDPVWDRELSGWGDPAQPPLWDYWVVDPTAAGGAPGTARPWDDPLMAWARNTVLASSSVLPDQTDWDDPLTDDQQCALWYVSELAFLLEDPRRQPIVSTASSSPLTCRDGHPLTTSPLRHLTTQRSVAPVTCPSYPGGRYTTTGPAYADLAYTQAGSNPAAGLRDAGAILSAAATGAPRAILLTDGGPRCGPNADARVSDCARPWGRDLRQAHGAMERAGVRLDVVSLADADTVDEATLEALPTHPGGLVPADAFPSVADALVHAWEQGRRSVLTRP